MTDDREVIAVLDALIDLLDEYDLSAWSLALASDRARVLAEDPDAYPMLRYRFSPGGLQTVWIALGDKHLNDVLEALRQRLHDLTAVEPDPEPDDPLPALYGERVDPEESEPRFARDFALGHVIVGDGGYLLRSTWGLLEYDEHNKFKLVLRVWRVSEPVSVEEYRSIRRATIGWWISLGGAPVATGFALSVVPAAGLPVLMWSCLILMVVAAHMIGVLERRSSAVVGIFSRRTGDYVVPQSRFSSRDANREELEEYFKDRPAQL
jgi:hypothetical protein